MVIPTKIEFESRLVSLVLGYFLVADILMILDLFTEGSDLAAMFKTQKDYPLLFVALTVLSIPISIFLGEILDTIGHLIFDEHLFRREGKGQRNQSTCLKMLVPHNQLTQVAVHMRASKF